MEMVRQAFRPEFINRLDEIVLFHRLFREHMGAIVDIQLETLKCRLEGRKITLSIHPEALTWLAEAGYDHAYGARPLKRVIQRSLENSLATMILDGKILDGEDVIVTGNKHGLIIKGKSVQNETS